MSAPSDEIVAISTTTLDTFGRFLISAGTNHFVSDQRAGAGGPGEAVTAGELLLASLGSCSLGLIQKTAGELNIALKSARADVTFRRHESDPKQYDWIRIAIRLSGPTESEGARLVEGFTSRCPIYNTLKRGSPVSISYEIF